MAEAKIEIKVGAVSFSGEGESKWLFEQLDKILTSIPQLSKVSPPEGQAGDNDPANASRRPKASGTLAAFLKLKNASTRQVKKFLATSVWLHDRDGSKRLTTSNITKALADNQQSRLGNPADCLNQNVAKGFCEKDGSQFFVTDDGRRSLDS